LLGYSRKVSTTTTYPVIITITALCSCTDHASPRKLRTSGILLRNFVNREMHSHPHQYHPHSSVTALIRRAFQPFRHYSKLIGLWPTISSHCHSISRWRLVCHGRLVAQDQWCDNAVADIQQNPCQVWIPNSTPSILRYPPTAADSIGLANAGSVSGTGHMQSRWVKLGASERLQRLANAKLLELEGGHSCYLDSPGCFVERVWNYVKYLNLCRQLRSA
jgi:hypothetical protein